MIVVENNEFASTLGSLDSFLLTRILKLRRKPIESLVETIARGGTCCLCMPLALAEIVQAKLICDFGCVHSIWQILFIGKHQQHRIAQLVLVQHAHEFFACFADTLPIIRINDKNESLRILKVMTPQGPNLVLSANVPHGERDIFVLDCFDVETNGRNSGDNLAQLQLVQNRRFSGRIKPDH